MKVDKSLILVSLVESWKQSIVAGNLSLVDNDFHDAAKHYELARQCAKTLFEKWKIPSESISSLVVTYHNIASMHLKKGSPDVTLYYLETGHKIILYALLKTAFSDPRHPKLLEACNRTYKALIEYKTTGNFE